LISKYYFREKNNNSPILCKKNKKIVEICHKIKKSVKIHT